MRKLILVALMATGGMVVGSGATQRYMAQREGEAVIHIQSWDALKCGNIDENVVVRMLAKEKTISVVCE